MIEIQLVHNHLIVICQRADRDAAELQALLDDAFKQVVPRERCYLLDEDPWRGAPPARARVVYLYEKKRLAQKASSYG